MSQTSAPAPRRLILMRHAKSDWTAGQPDRERPLNRRGRLAAALMGAFLAEAPWPIDCALVSDARRTLETWERMGPLLPNAPAPQSTPSLYEAHPAALLMALRAAPETARTVLMLGHNPGLAEFAHTLAAPAAARPGPFPTASLAVFLCEAPTWREAAPGGFRLEIYEEPKGLV